jgi:hypothetical protein
VREHSPARLAGEIREPVLPARRIGVGELDLAHDAVVHELTHFVLAGDVPVQAGGTGTELLTETAVDEASHLRVSDVTPQVCCASWITRDSRRMIDTPLRETDRQRDPRGMEGGRPNQGPGSPAFRVAVRLTTCSEVRATGGVDPRAAGRRAWQRAAGATAPLDSLGRAGGEL